MEQQFCQSCDMPLTDENRVKINGEFSHSNICIYETVGLV